MLFKYSGCPHIPTLFFCFCWIYVTKNIYKSPHLRRQYFTLLSDCNPLHVCKRRFHYTTQRDNRRSSLSISGLAAVRWSVDHSAHRCCSDRQCRAVVWGPSCAPPLCCEHPPSFRSLLSHLHWMIGLTLFSEAKINWVVLKVAPLVVFRTT